ncbi:MAG: hypothetical protein LBO06_07465 [Bacteroidales bacterium]|jgi:hypothetical protein|nr:hypothetical protein [Bacteroidales bacterium]
MKSIKVVFYLLVFGFMSGCCLTSCIDEENFAEGSNVSLKFSADTLSFDTVFTQMGSITKQVLVYNNENSPVKINSVRLGGGVSSFFRLNTDGDTAIVARDVEIGAKDSIFIFVKVTINPTNQNNPLLISDSIILSFNNKIQTIQLKAYGQDAYYHLPTATLPIGVINNLTPQPYSLAHQDSSQQGIEHSGNQLTMKADKPHIIIGTYAVDSAYSLTIEAGCKLHFATNASLLAYTDATITAFGGQNDPIIFEGIRKDGHYPTIAGQWLGIVLWVGSKDNKFENCIIRNATIAIEIDSCVTANPTLSLLNTRIENISLIGLYSVGGNIDAKNTIIQNCGKYCAAFVLGGKYNFVHCTIENSWFGTPSSEAAIFMQDWYRDISETIQIRPITSFQMANCIIYGSKSDEIKVSNKAESPTWNYNFRSCLMKITNNSLQGLTLFNCITNSDPLFADISAFDLSVLAGSPAIGGGDGVFSYQLPYDINGNYRNNPPTIGAIEFLGR